MNLQPMGDRILATPIPEDDETPGGVIIPDVAKDKTQRATVVAIGEGPLVNGKREPIDLEIGDQIAHARYSGQELEFGGEKYLILVTADVIAKIVE